MERKERGELRGVILIECADDGTTTSIVGSFADRLEYGAMAVLKAMNIFATKIAENDGAGFSHSPALRTQEARGTPRGLQNTDFGELH